MSTRKDFLESDRWLALLAGLISFAIYVATMCPTVYEGDSGEILAAIGDLGVAHPTGFPLYLLVSKAAMIVLPFGETALRVNLVSALFASGAVAMLLLILRAVGLSRSASFGAALALALSATLWSHATAARVYAMSGFFILALLLIALLWDRDRRDVYFLLFGGVLGLALGSHVTVILTIPAALLLVVAGRRTIALSRALRLAVPLAVVIAALLYCYIPLAASRDPVVNWGAPTDLESFREYITQREYSFKMGTRGLEGTTTVLSETRRLIAGEYTWAGFALAAIGLVACWRRTRRVCLATALVALGNLALMIYYGNQEDLFTLYRYLLPLQLMAAVWLGFGLQVVVDLVRKLPATALQPVLLALVVLAVPAVEAATRHGELNRRGNTIVRDYARNLLESVPDGAILLSTGDAVTGPLLYAQHQLNHRRDVILVDRNLLTRTWYCRQLAARHELTIFRQLALADPRQRLDRIIQACWQRPGVYATFLSLDLYENSPVGLVVQLTPKSQPPAPDSITAANARLWDGFDTGATLDRSIHQEYMVRELVAGYAKALNRLAIFHDNQGRLQPAIAAYERSLEFVPDHFASLFNLAQIYQRESLRPERAGELLERARKVNPAFFAGGGVGSPGGDSRFAVVGQGTATAAGPAGDSAGSVAQGGSGDVDPDNAVAVFVAAAAELGRQGRHVEVAARYREALRLQPDNVVLHINLGNAYMNCGQPENAVAAYEDAIRIDPGEASALAYLNIGAYYANEGGDSERARTYLQNYVELDPGSPKATEVRSWLESLGSELPEATRDQ